MRNILLAAAAISVFAAPAFAQSGPDARGYGSLGYTHVEGDNATTGAVTGRLGVNLNRYLAVETEASVGVKDDDFTVAGVEGKLKHEYDAAIYGVGTLPINDNFELFGRVGYGTTKIKAEIPGVSASEDGESVNYGAGANYFFDGQNGIRGDWTRRDFRDDGGEVDTYGVSYIRRF